MAEAITAPTAGAIDRSRFLETSGFDSDGGHLIGRHPRDVNLSDLRALPAPQSPMKAIRAWCVDCSGGQPSETRKCVAVKCPLWPYRMGFSPYHAKSALAKNTGGLEAAFQDGEAL